MQLIKFESLEELNNYLTNAKNVKKVKLLTEGEMHTTTFYVLIDKKEEYQKEDISRD